MQEHSAYAPLCDAVSEFLQDRAKANEAASAGYYKVELPDANCYVEIGASEHAAIYKIKALKDEYDNDLQVVIKNTMRGYLDDESKATINTLLRETFKSRIEEECGNLE